MSRINFTWQIAAILAFSIALFVAAWNLNFSAGTNLEAKNIAKGENQNETIHSKAERH